MIDLVNLAASLDEETLKKIARTCLDEFARDDDSRTEWLARHAQWIELYHQMDIPVSPPWEGASTESIPILAEGANQFHSRAFKAIFPGNKLVKAEPTGKVDEASVERAKRVASHMDWQLMVRDRRYKRDKDALILSSAIHGSAFTKVYPCFDYGTYRPKVENVRAEDFVVDYGVGPRALEDVRRKTQIIYMDVGRSTELATQEWFTEPALPFQQGDTRETTRVEQEAEGVSEPTTEGKPAKLLEQHRYLDLNGDGIEEPYIVTLCVQSQKVLRIAARYEMHRGHIVPIEYFTHYPYLVNPDGFFALGLGHLLGKINTAVNKLLRETVDAAELANIGNMSGFISDGMNVPGQELEFELGKFRKIKAGNERMADLIYQFKFPGPVPAMAQLMQLLLQRGDRLGLVTEAITGETEKVMQPTALLALIDQALAPASTVYGRLIDSMGDEFDKIYRLNRLYMPEEEYFAVNDLSGALKQGEIAKSDYADDLLIRPIADPNMATEQQKMARAQALREWAVSSPLVMQNPEALYNAEHRYLEALGVEDIDSLLPPPPIPPVRVDDASLENMGALFPKPQKAMVFPDQDHQKHIAIHCDFLKSPEYGSRLSPEAYAYLENHLQTHIAFFYGYTEANAGEMIHGLAIEGGMDALAAPAGGQMASGDGPGPAGGGVQEPSPQPGSGQPRPAAGPVGSPGLAQRNP